MRELKIAKRITQRNFTSIDKYLQDISKIPLIASHEEAELTKRIKSGDLVALEKLVTSNLRFVVSVAKQYQHYGLSLGDLINEGNIGLIKAAHRFDESRGFKFISYGVWWIRQSILEAISEQSRIVRLPQNRIDTLNKINKASSRLEQRYEREPSPDELSEILNIPQDEIISIIKISARQLSIDEPFDNDSNHSLADMLPGTSITPDASLDTASLHKDIQRVILRLSPRRAKVLMLYFGLSGTKPESLENIAERLKITRERVRQIKDQALKEIKRAPITITFKSYLNQ